MGDIHEEQTGPSTMFKIELADPVTEAETRALAIANTFRDSIGEEIITGIIPGERSSGTDCVLARTFNANCSVGYESKQDGRTDPESGDFLDAEYGYVSFDEEEHAKAFAAAVNKHRLDDEPESVVREETSIPNYQWRATLPSAIAQIAVDFDHDDLEEKFYEQHYPYLGTGGAASILKVLAGEVA